MCIADFCLNSADGIIGMYMSYQDRSLFRKKVARLCAGIIMIAVMLVPQFSFAASHMVDASFSVAEFDAGLYAFAIDQNDKVIIGGNFTTYGGVSVPYIARLNTDGTLDETFAIGSGFNAPVRAIAIEPDGQIIVGGEFSTYNGSSSPGIIRLNADGTRDESFTIGTGFDPAGVSSLTLAQDGDIMAMGFFSTYNGDASPSVVRINSDGTRDATFDPGIGFNANPTVLAFDADGKMVVGGDFTLYDGTTTMFLVRLNADGSVDATFDTGNGPNGSIRGLSIDENGKVLVVGGFTEYDGTPAGNIIRLNADGSPDLSFSTGTGFDQEVSALAFDAAGKIIAVGGFSDYNGVSRSKILRLNTDGTLDETFDGGSGFDLPPEGVGIDGEGRMLVRGILASFNGTNVLYLTRLVEDVTGPVISSFTPEDDATGVTLTSGIADLAFQFDENVVVGTGNITLHQSSDDSVVETFDVTDGDAVQVAGTNVTLTSAVTLGYDTDYYILIDAGAFEDEAGNPFAGIADATMWNFTTRVAPPPRALDFERASVNDAGAEGNGASQDSSLSGDGRYVAFYSEADNLVPGDMNSLSDVFVYDRDTDTIERVSVNDAGEEGDGASYSPSLSSDGRFVAFFSDATNFVTGDTNGTYDVFVYDRDTDTIERVSVNDAGEESPESSNDPSISADGRYVAFFSNASNFVADDTNDVQDIFVYDRDTDTIERVSVNDEGVEGNSYSDHAVISANGRYVVFDSTADNLVTGDIHGAQDIFVYDRDTDTVERVSVNDAGEEGEGSSNTPFISADGRFVTFTSGAENLVADDANGTSDVFVYDRDTDTIERIGDDAEASYAYSISGDGRYVGFIRGSRLYRYDRDEAELLWVSEGALREGDEVGVEHGGVSFSTDGHVIAFQSSADNLVEDDTNAVEDVFVYAESTTVDDAPPSDDGGTSPNGSHRHGGGASSSYQGDDIARLERLVVILQQILNFLMGKGTLPQ